MQTIKGVNEYLNLLIIAHSLATLKNVRLLWCWLKATSSSPAVIQILPSRTSWYNNFCKSYYIEEFS